MQTLRDILGSRWTRSLGRIVGLAFTVCLIPTSHAQTSCVPPLISLITQGSNGSLVSWACYNPATGIISPLSSSFAGPNPWFDVVAAGADPTGVAASDVAINKASAACQGTGGTVFFPPGTYRLTSRINVQSNCNYLGIGLSSKVVYTTPASDNYPKFFCNGGTNVSIVGLNLSNVSTPTSLILWTNSEATINGQEGFFCLGCQDLEIHDNIASNLGGAGILVVRGARERIHNNIVNGNVRYGVYLLSDDNGTPTDDSIYANTCSNNGSFGNSGFQGRGIVATIAGSVLPVIGAINTKIYGNTCNGNSFWGIEVYRAASHTEIGFNTTIGNGRGGIHDYNNSFSTVHNNNGYGNGLANVPNEAGGTLPIQGYCIAHGGGYFSQITANDCHDNNAGGGNFGQINVNGEGDFTGSYGNSVTLNQVRNNLGSGQDIFISASANNTFAGAVQQFYKITAYDASRNVLAQSAEFSNTPAASSVNLITWTSVVNATSYVICRGTATNSENIGYISYANAFLDEKAGALFTCSPPGSGTTLTGVVLQNLTTASDTYGVIVAENNLSGTSTATPLSFSTFNTNSANNMVAVSNPPPQSDRSGTVTCATNTVQYVYKTPYINVPTVVISDDTTKGGANISAKDRFSFTVSCTGATDVVEYVVVPNPF